MRIMVDATVSDEGHVTIVINNAKKLFAKQKPQGKIDAHELIKFYCDEYKKRYNTNPHITPKAAGVAKRIISGMSLERAQKLVAHYLLMNEFYFVKKRHDLATFENNIESVHVSLETGLTVSDTKARNVEKSDTTRTAIRTWLNSKQEDV